MLQCLIFKDKFINDLLCEFHNVSHCELEDSFCVMEPLRKSEKYESALEHPVIHISVEFHNVLDCELGESFECYGPIMEVKTNLNQP